jgi:hypothetical protein
MPAKAGIQYAVSSRPNNDRLGVLGPRRRGDDAECVGTLEHPLPPHVLKQPHIIRIADTASRSRGALRPRYEGEHSRPLERGRAERRTLDASAASCAMKTSTRVSHHGHAGCVRRSARDGFHGLLRVLPGERPLDGSPLQLWRWLSPDKSESTDTPPHGARRCAGITRLGPSARHRRRHRTTAHPKADARPDRAAPCGHRIPPRGRDDRERPSHRGETNRNIS